MIVIIPHNQYSRNAQSSNRITGHYSPESTVFPIDELHKGRKLGVSYKSLAKKVGIDKSKDEVLHKSYVPCCNRVQMVLFLMLINTTSQELPNTFVVLV